MSRRRTELIRAREDRSRRRQQPETHLWVGYLQAAGGLGAAVLGLTAYVYLLGGAVVWLRITAARLPADNATVAFQDRVLLAVGLKTLLFELVLLAALSLIVWFAWRAARRIDSQANRNQRHLVSYVIVVFLRSLVFALTVVAVLVHFDAYSGARVGLVLGAFVLLGLAIGAVDLTERVPGRLQELNREIESHHDLVTLGRSILTLAVAFVAVLYMAVPLGMTVLVLVALLQLDKQVDLLPKVTSMKELSLVVVILAAALNAIIVPYLATPPVTFDRATVVTKEGEEVPGAFIGRSGEGVFLATCQKRNATTSEEARVQVIPTEDVERVVLGGFRYSFDVGRRPSLFALARYFVNGEALHSGDDGFQLDIRGRREVCGVKGTPAPGPP